MESWVVTLIMEDLGHLPRRMLKDEGFFLLLPTICYVCCQSWLFGSLAPWIWKGAFRNDPRWLLDGCGPTWEGESSRLQLLVEVAESLGVSTFRLVEHYHKHAWTFKLTFWTFVFIHKKLIGWLDADLFKPLVDLFCFLFCFLSLIYLTAVINFCLLYGNMARDFVFY